MHVKVLAAKERPVPEATDAYQSLLATVTHEEMSGTLLPVISRMAKRSPDSMLSSAARVLMLVQLDLSQDAAALMADLQPLLRHVKPPIRCARGA